MKKSKFTDAQIAFALRQPALRLPPGRVTELVERGRDCNNASPRAHRAKEPTIPPPPPPSARVSAEPGSPAPAQGPHGIEIALYRTVHNTLRAEVQDGTRPVGASLPSEADLALRFGVSRITIRHALRLLEDEGHILKAKARRAVVVAREPPRASGWVVESIDDIATMVGDATLEISAWRPESAATEARLLGLPPATHLPCLRGVLHRSGRPYARSIIYFPPDIGAGLRREAFDDAVVFRVMQRELLLRLAYVEITAAATHATPEDAAALPCRVGDPILLTQLLYYDDASRLVEIAYSRGLADATRFATRITATPRPR